MAGLSDFFDGMHGVVFPFGGTNAPNGFLMCNGQAVSRTTYAALFAVIGTTFGVGDNSTTFNVPDLRGRVPAGKDNMGGAAAASRLTSANGLDGTTLGAVGGAQTHTLTTAQMPAHNHGVTDPGHSHGVNDPGHSHSQQSWNLSSFDATGGPHQVGADAPGSGALGGTNYTSFLATGVTVAGNATGISTQNNGSGTAHNITQPTMVMNYIIKT